MPRTCDSREAKSRYEKARREKLLQRRSDFIKQRGGRCECCGEDRMVFLAIDHVDGGGHRHRRSRGPHSVMLDIESEPHRYRVLCHNCNFAITRGVCPHKGAK